MIGIGVMLSLLKGFQDKETFTIDNGNGVMALALKSVIQEAL